MMRFPGPVVAWLLSGALVGVPAHASDNSAAAETLFRAGRDAMAEKNYDLACSRFNESLNLERTVGTRLNLANCEQLRGNVATAWQHFDAAKRGLPESDRRYQLAASQANALEQRLPKIEIQPAASAPANIKVVKGDTTFTKSAFGLPLPVDPGKFTLRVEAPGHEPNEVPVEIAEGELLVVEISPGPKLVDAPPPIPEPSPQGGAAPAKDEAPAAPPESGGISPLALVFGGVGLAAIGAGVFFQLKGASDEDHLAETCGANPDAGRPVGTCNEADVDAVDMKYRLAPISVAVGAAALGAGAYFLFFTGGGGEESTSRSRGLTTEVGLLPTLGGGSVSVRSRF